MTKNEPTREKMMAQIRAACQTQFGVLDSNFLCRPVSSLNLMPPRTITADMSVDCAMRLMKENRIGCLLVVDGAGKVSGIFSERDCILKVFGCEKDLSKTPISEFMTPDPVCEFPDTTVAYALNVMSHGGFRHIPIVDGERVAVGIVSVKDIVDNIVAGFMEDLLNFPIEA